MTLKAGYRWLAASLIAYWRESFSLRKYNDGSFASIYKLVTGEMLPKPNVVLDDEQYLTFVNRTCWQSHTKQIHSLTLTELKNDTDVKVWNDLLPNSYLIKLQEDLKPSNISL